MDDTAPTDAESSAVEASAGNRKTGRDVVRRARNHIGTRYRNSPPRPCRAFESEDCSCHTKLVFKSLGKRLPDNPVKQFQKGRRVAKSNLRKGDLVFFKEAGPSRPITHVAIYSGKDSRGDRKIIHASNFFGKVVESKMKYMRGYYAAKRLRLN